MTTVDVIQLNIIYSENRVLINAPVYAGLCFKILFSGSTRTRHSRIVLYNAMGPGKGFLYLGGTFGDPL